MLAPKPITKSTYSFASTSQIFDPSDRVVAMGYTISFQICLNPATDRGSARTGRFCMASFFEPAVRRVYRAIITSRARLWLGDSAISAPREIGLKGPCDLISD